MNFLHVRYKLLFFFLNCIRKRGKESITYLALIYIIRLSS
nr:MAG TPA: hypothetical protein [Caudoviricetes sp.]